MRFAGATDEDIAGACGGILSTVNLLRVAIEDALHKESVPRLKALMAEGLTTIEIKFGYDLDVLN
jgi:imidazolonepropionase